MLRFSYLGVFLLLAVAYYYVLGYGPTASEIYDEFAWWQPRGFVHRWLIFSGLSEMARAGDGAGRFLPVVLFGLPPVALTVLGFALFRNAAIRAWLFWLGLVTCAFTYYGLVGDKVWRFFEWRFALVVASFGAVLAICLFAPSLLRALRALPRVVAGAILLAFFALAFVLSTEVTGTDPNMRFNISPWPVVTVFGFLLTGYAIAAIHVGAGAGIYVAGKLSGGPAQAAALGTALVAGALCAYIPFNSPGVGQIAAMAIVCTIYAAVAYSVIDPDDTKPTTSGLSRIAAGALLIAMIGISNQVAISNQLSARDETANELLVALNQYRDAHAAYPEKLRELVPEYLAEIPRPRIGLFRDEGDEFLYSKYSQEDFSLEFASVQWVQCAYSPPYEFATYEDDEDTRPYQDAVIPKDGPWETFDDADVAAKELTEDERIMAEALEAAGLDGAWSCPEEPPKLW